MSRADRVSRRNRPKAPYNGVRPPSAISSTLQYVGFYCLSCRREWPNPDAKHERSADGKTTIFRTVINALEPRLCDDCQAREIGGLE